MFAALFALCAGDVVWRKLEGLFEYLRSRKEILAEMDAEDAHPFRNPKP